MERLGLGGAAVTSVPESLVAAKVVRNDGRTPFLRPQKGVAPVDGDDLVTRAWAIANLGGGGIVDGDKGDVTVVSGVWTIDAGVVTNAKQANMAGGTVKGRKTASGTGAPQDLTPSEARTELGLGALATLSTVDVTTLLNYGGAADRIAGSDSSGNPKSLRNSDVATILGLASLAYLDFLDAAQLTTGVLDRARLGTGTPTSSTYLRGDGVWSATSAFAAASHTHAAADVTSGVFAVARLGSGTPSSTTFLRGDGAWSTTTVFAAASHTHSGADITSGTVAAARLGSGTADSTTFLRGDGTWAVPAAGGGGIEFGVAKRLAYLRL